MQQTCRFIAGHVSTSTLNGDLKYCLRTLRLGKADDATCIPGMRAAKLLYSVLPLRLGS